MDQLVTVLEPEELSSLPDSVKNKLVEWCKVKQTAFDELKAASEKGKVDFEQRFFETEKLLIENENKLSFESTKAAELKQRIQCLENQYQESFNLANEQKIKLSSLEIILAETQRERDGLQGCKDELSQILERKNQEITRLNSEWKLLSDKALAAANAKGEAEAKLEQFESKCNTLTGINTRIVQEKEQLQQQRSWFEKELQQKTDEFLNSQKDMSAQLIQLQGQLDNRDGELRHLESVIESLKNGKQEMEEKIETLLTNLKETQDHHTEIEEQLKEEICEDKKLLSLYKESADESKKKEDELVAAVKELKMILKQASTAHTELQKQKKEEAECYEKELKNRQSYITQLSKELENAQKFMKSSSCITEESVDNVSPSAAAAARLLKSGMTLTQIYSEYVQVSESLLVEKEENKRLSQYLDQILQEIEDKAPIMKHQRDEYEKSLGTINQLTQQLEAVMHECEIIRVESADLSQQLGQSNRDNQRLKQESADLCQQVKFLLKELEEARGNVVSCKAMVPDITLAEDPNSSDLIPQKYICFSSIEELQEQNQRLLNVIRELSSKEVEKEKTKADERLAGLKDQLDSALEEIENMKIARESLVSKFDTVVRQRDMYRVLLQQTGDGIVSPMTVHIPEETEVTSTPTKQNLPTQEMEMQLKETTVALNELKAEYCSFRKDMKETETLLKQKVEDLQKESSNLRVTNAKLTSQLEYSGEKIKLLQTNLENQKKELLALEGKNKKYAESVIQKEQTVIHLKQDIKSAQRAQLTAEGICQGLRAENEMLRRTEIQHNAERDRLLQEKYSQNVLLNSLQAIQEKLEKAENEAKLRYESHINTLEKECDSLKQQVEKRDIHHKMLVDALQNDVKQAQAGEKKAIEDADKFREERQTLLLKVKSLESDFKGAQEQCKAAELRLSNISEVQKQMEEGSVSLSAYKDLELQLKESCEQVEALRVQIKSAREHADQFKQLADNLEHKMNEQSDSEVALKQEIDCLKAEIQQHVHDRQSMAKSFETERSALMKDVESEKLHISEITNSFTEEITALKKQLADTLEEKHREVTQEVSARNDLRIRNANLSKRVEELEKKLEAPLKELEQSKQKMNAKENERALQEVQLKDQIKKLEMHSKELSEQNKILHDELELLSQHMLRFENTSDKSGEDTPFQKDSKVSEQILDLIQYLRKEKDVLDTKVLQLTSENLQIKQTMEKLQLQIAERNETFETQLKPGISTSTEHTELMDKIEKLNSIDNENTILKAEKEQLELQQSELKEKLRALEKEMEPLKNTLTTIQGDVDKLQSEKEILEKELEQWKERANGLIEQTNRSDPEKYKRIMLESETIKKANAQLALENKQNKEETSRLSSAIDTKEKDIAEKTKTITQLRNIGRKYKSLSEEAQKELEELKSKIAHYEQEIAAIPKLQQQIKEAEQTVSVHQEKLKLTEASESEQKQKVVTLQDHVTALQTKVKTIENEQVELQKKLQQKEIAVSQLSEKLGSADVEKSEAVQKLQQEEANRERIAYEMKKTIEELEKTKANEAKLKEENEEREKKSKNLIQAAKQRIATIKDERDKLASENSQLSAEINGLKLKVSNADGSQTGDEIQLRLESLKSQYEAKVRKLENEVTEVKHSQDEKEQAYSKLVSEKEELQKRVSLLQKTVESCQEKLVQQQPSGKIRVADRTERTLPITTESPRTASIRPMASPSAQPHVSGQRQVPRAGSAESRALASIRPMAQAPTPTATVLPTAASSQDDTSSSDNPASVSRPRQQVQPLSPHVDPVPETAPVPAFEAREPMPSGSGTGSVLQQPKRPREEESPAVHQVEDMPEFKRSRVQGEQVQEEEQEEQLEDFNEDENPDDTEQTMATPKIPAGEAKIETKHSLVENTETAASDEDVMILEEEPCIDEDVGFDVEDGEYDDVNDMPEDADEEHGDDDVVIVVDEPEDTGVSQGQAESVSSQVQVTAGSSQVSPNAERQRLSQSQVPFRTDRLVAGSRSQLTPFMLGTQPFEEGDDGIVPSTPTLFVPPRSDGFAEAISSPQVAHRGFFSGGDSTAVDFTQLATQGALGVDATRMELDLGQLDDVSGRSMPTTPLQTTPPSISVTEVQAGEDLNKSQAQAAEAKHDSAMAGQDTPSGSKISESAKEHADRTLSEEAGDSVSTTTTSSFAIGQLLSAGALTPEVQSSDKPDLQTGDPTSEAGPSQPDSGDRSDQSKRTPITPIVWDAPSISEPPSQAQSVQPTVASQRARRGLRGTGYSRRSNSRAFRGRGTGRGFIQRPQQF